MSDTKIYIAKKLFTGTGWLYHQALVVKEDMIVDMLPASDIEVPPGQIIYRKIIPSFIDLQIYGAHKKLFAVYPEADSLYKLYDYCSKGGALHFMPTVATNTGEVFYRCIDAVKKYREQGGKGCLGLHIEGPWINPVKRGAHIESLIHTPSIEEVKELLAYGKGVIRMITLAPEICSDEVIELIQSYDIIISAGHSNATYHQAMRGFEKGIGAVTHLYNAMSPLQHREPGLVGATFNHHSVMASIIPDGYHVDFAAVKIAKRQLKERLFVITDAVTTTDNGPYPHRPAGDKYESNGILSGSALTMIKAVKNLVEYCDIEMDEAIRMCSLYPAKVLGMDHQLGKIGKGFQAGFIGIDEELNVVTA